MRRAAVLAAALTWACSRRVPIGSCDDDLGGVYAAGAERTERWMVLDHGPTLEAYPLFPDASGPADLVMAPRVIELVRGPAVAAGAPGTSEPRTGSGATDPRDSASIGAAGRDGLAGTLRRRFMRRAESCDARVPVHVTRCAGDTLELVLADPAPPLGFSPCAWPGPGPSRIERWRRD